MTRAWLFLVVALTPLIATAQPAERDEPKKDKETPWYDRLAIRGYLQTRFNRVYVTEDDFKNDLGDKNLAENNSFSIRRARLIIQGDVAPFLFAYLQVEASGADVKMRDWYGDLAIDEDKEFRFRIGQSKVPFGWENLQSSQNRSPLDRSDPINSAAPGERDLGAYAMWAPKRIRKLFKHLVDSGLKGSGDYGVVALGMYNGQGINLDEKNENRHAVARLTYPFEIGDQILEVGANGYFGKFTVDKDMDVMGGTDIRDARIGGAVVLYPKPIGFQLEYNVGRGPELVDDTIVGQDLHGGYAMVIGHVRAGPTSDLFPFVRGAIYEGGIKSIKNAPRHESRELVIGTEWQYKKRFELTLEIDHAKRIAGDDAVWGTAVRLQAQFNY